MNRHAAEAAIIIAAIAAAVVLDITGNGEWVFLLGWIVFMALA